MMHINLMQTVAFGKCDTIVWNVTHEVGNNVFVILLSLFLWYDKYFVWFVVFRVHVLFCDISQLDRYVIKIIIASSNTNNSNVHESERVR